jgi:lipoyl-dependent peroxiredoxin
VNVIAIHRPGMDHHPIGPRRLAQQFPAPGANVSARNGRTEASDRSARADLSVPKAMGGPGKPDTTTPETLFAAGYATCFGNALDYVE